jgi:hypothetical protein
LHRENRKWKNTTAGNPRAEGGFGGLPLMQILQTELRLSLRTDHLLSSEFMRFHPSPLIALTLSLGLVACGGDSTPQAMQVTGDGQAAAGGQDVSGMQSSDDAAQQPPAVQNDAQQCDAPVFDIAELLFTEADRQWFCTVTTDTLSTEDQVYFARSGTAVTTRFRDVYWNRSMTDQSINVASPFISPFVIRNITSSNTVMSFDLVTDSGRTEVYDCVLVGREVPAPDLI